MNNEKQTICATYRSILECDAFTKYHSLPVLDAVGYNESYSYAACDAERRKCIKQSYAFASDRLTPIKEVCVSRECAQYYSQHIKSTLLPAMDLLKLLCEKSPKIIKIPCLLKYSKDPDAE